MCHLGLYKNCYDLFGRLTFEMMRAVRLVVDTGMHAMLWTRNDAINYKKEKTCIPLEEIEIEIDRYITWPGQACSYKVGEIKIREVRQQAEKQLGSKFDLREFHDVILNMGSVSLKMLEEKVRAWILEKSTS